MPSPVSFPVLRTPQAAQQSRVQDQIQEVVGPLAQKLSSTPIMGAAPPPWIRLSLLSGWTNLGGQFPFTSFHVDCLGYVHLRGYLVAGTLNAIAFQLPQGARPNFKMTFPGYVYNGAPVTGDIEVRPDGNVFFGVPALTTNVAIDSISFLAER